MDSNPLDIIFLNEVKDYNADPDFIKALHNAIINKRMISIDYEDDPDEGPEDGANRGWRKNIEPVCLGYGHVKSNKNNDQLYLRAWQNGGVSKRGITNEDGVNWKLYKVSRIRSVSMGTKNFDGPKRYYNPFTDKTIKNIHRYLGVPSIADFRKETGVQAYLDMVNVDTIGNAIKKKGVQKPIERLDLDKMPDLSIIKPNLRKQWYLRIIPDLRKQFQPEEIPIVKDAIEAKLYKRKLKTFKDLFESI